MPEHALAMFDQPVSHTEENLDNSQSLSTEVVSDTLPVLGGKDIADKAIDRMIDEAISTIKEKNDSGEIRERFLSRLNQEKISFL